MFKLLGLLSLFIIPISALAHTRWFLNSEVEPLVTTEPTSLYLVVAFGSILLVVMGSAWLHKHNFLNLKQLRPSKAHAYERAASTFTMVIGAFLLIAGTHEYLFSPNLSITSGVPTFLIVIEILIGIAFLVGVFTRVSAILLGLLWFIAVYFSGWLMLIENIWVLSTAVFILVMGNDYFSLVSSSLLKKNFSQYKKQALSILRIGTGATLVILGFSEKIFTPEYGLHFLSLHNWNFMQLAGFNFSDYLFTLSAGSVEILLGLIFVLGIVTRLNAVITATIFSIPLFILGPIELAGHLPHFAAIVLFVFFGGGGRYSIFKQHKDETVVV